MQELLKLAQDCYAQARITKDLEAKQTFIRLGDQHLKEADELQHGRSVVQAAFPRSK